MAETNLSFDTTGTLLLDAPLLAYRPALAYRMSVERQSSITIEAEQQRAIVAQPLTSLTNPSSLTLGSSVGALEFGLELATASAFSKALGDVLRTLAIIEPHPKPIVMSGARYRPRQITTSDATAFSNIESLRSSTEPNLIPHLLRYLRMLFRPSYGTGLATRIEQLAEIVLEESDGAERISGLSVAHMIAFLEQNPTVVRPKLAAGPSGEIIAFWRRDEQAEFSARFLTNGTVRFLVKSPNTRNPSGIDRASGETTCDQLLQKAHLNELDWVAA